MAIKQNDVVSIAYEVKNEEGIVVDESTIEQPLEYIHGHENLIPGLEKALEGRAVGDKFEVTVAPEEAYGEYLDELVQRVPANLFQGVEEITVGMRFLADTDQGPLPVEITEVDGDDVVVDANHMLAGQTISFSVEVVAIREATEEEVAHGHIHQADGCGCGGHEHEHEHKHKHECCGGGEEKESCCGRCH